MLKELGNEQLSLSVYANKVSHSRVTWRNSGAKGRKECQSMTDRWPDCAKEEAEQVTTTLPDLYLTEMALCYFAVATESR